MKCRILTRPPFSIILLLISLSQAFPQAEKLALAPLFTDNMVIQQDAEASLWGTGYPGSVVTVSGSWGDTGTTAVGADSIWMLTLRTPPAGGPFDITLADGRSTITISNVLSGEVWLCSGQSNMEMTLKGWPPTDTIMNAAHEIAAANDPGIRLFTVQRNFSPVPLDDCAGSWVECSPASVKNFSATAYFFGRSLRNTLHVPIGLISTSWGGTAIHSWISRRFLSRASQFDSTLQLINETAKVFPKVAEWQATFPAIDMKQRVGDWKNLHFDDEGCASRSLNDSAWHEMNLPMYWERGPIGEFDGVVWFRKEVPIPEQWLRKDLVLELGPIDDMDVTYVNGTMVGGHELEGEHRINRVYTIPGSVVDTTLLTIAIRVIDFGGGGGLFGKPQSLVLHSGSAGDTIPLAGSWKYRVVAEYRPGEFRVFGARKDWYDTRPSLPTNFSGYSPTALYNAMIHPLIPYTIKGAIWYQGEADVSKPDQYKQLLPMMIKNWREEFKSGDFPFYYVQIAPFEYGPSSHSELLREAQTGALAVNNTGMAVTLDIGNPANIHPADKQDVGKRLALWALARTYDRKLEYSGPLLTSVKKRNNAIELTFNHARSGLEIRAAAGGNGFQIAGADREFHDAKVVVKGSTLLISNADVRHPVAVRYAFSNTPVATLFNKDGLPAPSFRTDSW